MHKSTVFKLIEQAVIRPPVHRTMETVVTTGEPDYRLQREQPFGRLRANTYGSVVL